MSRMFAREHIRLHVDLQNKDAYLKYLAALSLELGIGKSEQGVYEDLVKREQEFSTNLGGGIAIPHAKSDAIVKPAILVIKPRQAIVWENDEEETVRMIICIVSRNEQKGNVHLKVLAGLARKLIDENFKNTLVETCDEQTIFNLLEQALCEE